MLLRVILLLMFDDLTFRRSYWSCLRMSSSWFTFPVSRAGEPSLFGSEIQVHSETRLDERTINKQTEGRTDSTYPAPVTHATLRLSSSESSRTCLACSSSVRELRDVAVWSKMGGKNVRWNSVLFKPITNQLPPRNRRTSHQASYLSVSCPIRYLHNPKTV